MSTAELLERARADTFPLLNIDRAVFASHFPGQPFLIGHRLAGHALFALPRLIELAKHQPPENVEYNAGDLPVNQDPKRTPRNGLSVEETIRRIEECRSWLVLKHVEQDPEYHDLLHDCLSTVEALLPPRFRPVCRREGFIFVSSPGSVTPYHMDDEHNFLLQVRGRKVVNLFDADDRSLLSEEEIERHFSGAHRNLSFKDEYQRKAQVFELSPGQALHFPVNAPHWVKNGAEVSVSFSITFRTRATERRETVYFVNNYLRGRGLKPAPFGQSPWRDSVKYNAWRVVRKLRRFLPGKKSAP